jgi:hypothetical protein
MPFRLDDILLMDWAMKHRLLDAFDPVGGQLVNSYRPVFALAAFVLTHVAGWAHPFWWHLTLTLSLLTGLAFVGLTARYLAERWYALQISTALYWLAFTAILNVFFWYSDLTFGLELAFTAPAWYFGLRGLYEARLKLWLLAMGCASLAVMSKEPAFVLVHVVLVGSFAIERNGIVAEWLKRPRSEQMIAIAGYAILLAITAFIILVSPTRGNRFFTLSSPDLGHYIRDRVDYYSSVYLAVGPRLLLFFPVAYSTLSLLFLRRAAPRRPMDILLMTVLSLVATLLLFSNILIALPLLTLALAALSVYPNAEMHRARRMLPFLACILIASGALLFTIQLVKTQLTEVAMLTLIISGWGWSFWMEEVGTVRRLHTGGQARRGLTLASLAILAVSGTAMIFPRLARQERLLRQVRDVRKNSNDALTWAAEHLPQHSLFAVAQYRLHGIENMGDLTSKDDETKLREQYTFEAGFVYYVLEVLGRRDIQHAYLANPALLPRVLGAMRVEKNAYLFLQSELDLKLFHGADAGQPPLLGANDTLVAQFARGPYPSEIWMLRE